MKEVRCPNCGRKLFEVEGSIKLIKIKCNKCKKIIEVKEQQN